MGDSTSHNTESISPQAPMNRVVRTPIADASASLWPDNRQRPGVVEEEREAIVSSGCDGDDIVFRVDTYPLSEWSWVLPALRISDPRHCHSPR